jgi:hypothetical protein
LLNVDQDAPARLDLRARVSVAALKARNGGYGSPAAVYRRNG